MTCLKISPFVFLKRERLWTYCHTVGVLRAELLLPLCFRNSWKLKYLACISLRLWAHAHWSNNLCFNAGEDCKFSLETLL